MGEKRCLTNENDFHIMFFWPRDVALNSSLVICQRFTWVNIAEIDLIYQNETEEEKLERGKRYEEAFEQLFIRLENLMGVWKLELDEYKDKVMQKFTEKSKKEDAEALSDIETSIDKQ